MAKNNRIRYRTLSEKKDSIKVFSKYINENFKDILDNELSEILPDPYDFVPFTNLHNNNVDVNIKDILNELYMVKISTKKGEYKVFIKERTEKYITNSYEYHKKIKQDFNQSGIDTDKFKVSFSLAESIKYIKDITIHPKYKWMGKCYGETKSLIVMEDIEYLPSLDSNIKNIENYSKQLSDIILDIQKDPIYPSFNLYSLRIRNDKSLVWSQSFDWHLYSKDANFIYLPDDPKIKSIEYSIDLNRPLSLNQLLKLHNLDKKDSLPVKYITSSKKIKILNAFDNINNNTGNVVTPRLYEQEAIKCFTEWRKNAGNLKDIKIICYAPSKNLPSKETISKLKKLKVTYIEKYLPVSDRIEFGFFLVPLVGSIIEKEYPNKTLIHIDLDMNIIKPIPDKYFDDNIYIGQYDDISSLTQRYYPKWKNPLDTGFTISPTNSKFYEIYWEEFSDLYFNKKYETEEPWLIQNHSNKYFLEEYVADKLYNLQILDIKPIQYYQIGEGYVNVDQLSDEQLNQTLFWHEHLFVENSSEWSRTKIRQKIEFFKRFK